MQGGRNVFFVILFRALDNSLKFPRGDNFIFSSRSDSVPFTCSKVTLGQWRSVKSLKGAYLYLAQFDSKVKWDHLGSFTQHKRGLYTWDKMIVWEIVCGLRNSVKIAETRQWSENGKEIWDNTMIQICLIMARFWEHVVKSSTWIPTTI